MNRPNRCDGCQRPFLSNDRAVALIPEILIHINDKDDGLIRLKLSDGGINVRTMKIYCINCLNVGHYIREQITIDLKDE